MRSGIIQMMKNSRLALKWPKCIVYKDSPYFFDDAKILLSLKSYNTICPVLQK